MPGRSGAVANVALASFLLVSLMAGVEAAAPDASGSTTPVLIGCFAKRSVKPTSYVLSCADDNAYLTAMHWSIWSTRGGRGSGTFHVNPCVPYCAASRIAAYRATVKLAKPVQTKMGLVFSELVVSYVAGKKTERYTFEPTT